MGLIPGPDANASLDAKIVQAATANGIAPGLLKGLVKIESGFDPKIVSRMGAVGLTQLMPGTAASLGVTDSTDEKQNLNGGAKYLKQLIDKNDGNVTNALREYNGGNKWKTIPSTKMYAISVEAAAKTYGWNGNDKNAAGNNSVVGTTVIGDTADKAASAMSVTIDSLGDIANTLQNIVKALFDPSTYVRLGKGLLGAIALILGAWALFSTYKTAGNGPAIPTAPKPPIPKA